MNPQFDKEIDSLLRRTARTGASSAEAPGRALAAQTAQTARATAHLDPDELSAFAEGVLPPAARSFAASHLADCDACRGVIIRLASATEVATEERRAATVPPVVAVSLWQRLSATIFAPRILRYATPVLVLGLVGVVSFIALRSNRGVVPETAMQSAPSENTSSRTSTVLEGAPVAADVAANAPATTSASPGSSPQRGTIDSLERRSAGDSVEEGAAAAAGSGAKADKDASLAARTAGDLPAPAPVAVGGGVEVAKKEQAIVVDGRSDTATPPAAKLGPDNEPAKAKVANETQARKGEAEPEILNDRYRQAEQNRAANQVQSRKQEAPDDSVRSENRSNMGNMRGYGVNQAPSRREKSAPKRDSSGDNTTTREDDEIADPESQNFAGHRFRRQGNAWIDVNYKTSMRITGVRRGTEGYRALVADFPVLGRIAEHFGGEVITVIKGQAYRVR